MCGRLKQKRQDIKRPIRIYGGILARKKGVSELRENMTLAKDAWVYREGQNCLQDGIPLALLPWLSFMYIHFRRICCPKVIISRM